MTTSNYKLDTRYALVDTDIINDKKNIIYTEVITFFHSIGNHIYMRTFHSNFDSKNVHENDMSFKLG